MMHFLFSFFLLESVRQADTAGLGLSRVRGSQMSSLTHCQRDAEGIFWENTAACL